MRLSIVRQYWSLLQVYLQKPPRHFFGVPAVPPHSLSVVQFGFGRVSTTHAPWLQYLPAPQSESPAHAVGLVGPLGTVGLQTPFSQLKPEAHGAASQLVRHCPSAQTLLSGHSLEYLHVFSGAVHAPP